MNDLTPLTDAEISALATRHAYTDRGMCLVCEDTLPCEVSRLVANLQAARQRIADLEAQQSGPYGGAAWIADLRAALAASLKNEQRALGDVDRLEADLAALRQALENCRATHVARAEGTDASRT